MNIALFASGNGSNVQAIIDTVKAGELDADISYLICDQPGAYVIERGKKENIPVLVSSPKDFESREEWERHVIDYLKKKGVELIVLAGFMRLLKKPMLQAFPNKIINIHPSLLPAFPGKNGIKDAYEAGVKKTGVSVFYVDEGMDTGRIIAQEPIDVDPAWSLEELEQAIHQVEHRLYPAVLQKLQNEQFLKGD